MRFESSSSTVRRIPASLQAQTVTTLLNLMGAVTAGSFQLLTTSVDVDHVNNLGWTALLEAVILGDGGPAHTQIVRLLVDGGANVSIPDRGGVTALQHARRSGYREIVSILEAVGR